MEITSLVIQEYSPASRDFFSLRSEYSPQHPVIRHTQFTVYSRN